MKEPIDIFGNYDTKMAANLMIVFEKCDKKVEKVCKSDAEINEWLAFKYIILLENEKRFIQHEFGDSRVKM